MCVQCPGSAIIIINCVVEARNQSEDVWLILLDLQTRQDYFSATHIVRDTGPG